MKENNELLLKNLRCIPDWPKKGVNFRDVTTLFKSPECLKEINREMYELYKGKGITKIVGIESRGFVMSSALALELGAGVVLCRKPGKLPCDTVQESYAKSMARTPSRSTAMPSTRTTSSSSTTTCSPQEAP